MAQTSVRKWVMVPADFENSETTPPPPPPVPMPSVSPQLSKQDVEVIIQFAKQGKINSQGCLLGSSGSFMDDTHILDCLLQKNTCPHFKRFLELKALSPIRPTATAVRRVQPKRSKKQTIRGARGGKKPKKGDWDWDDDDEALEKNKATKQSAAKSRRNPA
jgi:hypothetical protein